MNKSVTNSTHGKEKEGRGGQVTCIQLPARLSVSVSLCPSNLLPLPAPSLSVSVCISLPSVQLRAEGPEGCQLSLCCPVSPSEGGRYTNSRLQRSGPGPEGLARCPQQRHPDLPFSLAEQLQLLFPKGTQAPCWAEVPSQMVLSLSKTLTTH